MESVGGGVLSAILDPKAVVAFRATGKDSAIAEMLNHLEGAGLITGAGRLHGAFMARERLASTGIGDGVAVPHIRWQGPSLAGVGVSRDGIPFDALDGKPAHILFFLFAMEGRAGENLKVMARISRLARDTGCMERIKNCSDMGEIIGIIRRIEGEIHS